MGRACVVISVLLCLASPARAANAPAPRSVIPVVGRDGKPLLARIGGKLLQTPNGALHTGRQQPVSVYVNPSFKISTRAGGPALTVGEWRALGVEVNAIQPSRGGRITGLMLVTGSGFNAAAAARLGMGSARPGQIVGFSSERSGSPAAFGTVLGRIGQGL